MREIANIIISGTCHTSQHKLIKNLNHLNACEDTELQKKHQNIMSRVGLNYGLLGIDSSLDLRLWGMPSTVYHQRKWAKLYESALGIIFLINLDCDEDIWLIHGMVNFFRAKKLPTVFGLTSQKPISSTKLDEVAKKLKLSKEILVPCNPYHKNDIKILTLTLLLEIEKKSNICRRSSDRENNPRH